MWHFCKGSSLVEVLAALFILSVSSVGVALVQKETEQHSEQVRWRWQAHQWLEALAQNITWQQRLGVTFSPPNDMCGQALVAPDCSREYCSEQQASQWQQQRVCHHINTQLQGPSVQLQVCDGALCLLLAPNQALAQQCHHAGHMCLRKLLPQELSHAAF